MKRYENFALRPLALETATPTLAQGVQEEVVVAAKFHEARKQSTPLTFENALTGDSNA